MRNVIILQARLASSRFPERVLAEVSGRPVVAHILERLQAAKDVNEVCVAMPTDAEEDKLAEVLAKLDVRVVRGSSSDVLARFIQAAYETKADVIIRAKADDLFVSPVEVDRQLETLTSDPEADYVVTEGYPQGITPETFTLKTLEKLDYLARHIDERKDATLYLRNNPGPFQIRTLKAPAELNDPTLRLSVDTPRDLELVKQIYGALHKPGELIDLKAVLELLRQDDELLRIGRTELAAWAKA